MEVDEDEDEKVPGGLKSALEDLQSKNMSLMAQLTLQDGKLKALEEILGNFTARPILEYDEAKLKELVCDTFRANKRGLMRRGAT